MRNEEFRVLLIYSNSPMDNLMPISVSSVSGALKRAGFEVKLFDNTFYPGESKSGDDERVATLQIPAFNYEDVGISYKKTNPFDDLRALVKSYQPHLIGLSAVEPTYLLGIRFLKHVRDLGIPTIVGGVHTIFSPEDVFKENVVDMICLGEGEECMVELCEKMARGDDYTTVANLWVKKDGREYRNPKSEVQDLTALPLLDFEIFEKERFYRPMAGKIYRMVPAEFSRGCIYKCAYCSAPGFAETFKDQGKWLRDKPMNTIIDELKFYVSKYKIEYFYMVSETFLAMPRKRFAEFVEGYKDIRLPFWFNTRPETITEENVRTLEEINCHRMSIGVEAGNEEYRKTMLKRPVSNEKTVRACQIVASSKIQLSVNNIVGFPDETREMIFDTININREFNAASHGAYIFQPYRGTWLHEYCVKKAYINPNDLAIDLNLESCLNQPHITKEEIKGLHRTFPLYVKFPKSEWPLIQRAEKFDNEGNKVFEELGKIYREKYFHSSTLESPLNPNHPNH